MTLQPLDDNETDQTHLRHQAHHDNAHRQDQACRPTRLVQEPAPPVPAGLCHIQDQAVIHAGKAPRDLLLIDFWAIFQKNFVSSKKVRNIVV